MASLRGPEPFYLYASFFTDFYLDRHLLSLKISGPMMLMPGMQDRLDAWVEKHVDPDRLFRVDRQDMDSSQINKILDDLQAQLKYQGVRSL